MFSNLIKKIQNWRSNRKISKSIKCLRSDMAWLGFSIDNLSDQELLNVFVLIGEFVRDNNLLLAAEEVAEAFMIVSTKSKGDSNE